MTDHHCHAIGCLIPCPPAHLMCSGHWRRVRAALAAAVWREFVPGQERKTLRPTPRWRAVAWRAVAESYGGDDPALQREVARFTRWSERARAQSIHEGTGDPLEGLAA